MTEPTPDTPESELTGDGLRAIENDLFAYWSDEDTHYEYEATPEGEPILFVRWDVMWKRVAAIVAALPNREAAPREGLDVERLAAALCATRDPAVFPASVGDMFVDDECRAWGKRLAAEYDRLGR